MTRIIRRSPSRIVRGGDALTALSDELERAGVTQTLVVCGSTLGDDVALTSRVRRAAGGRIADFYTGVRAHSPLDSVLDGVRILTNQGCDGIVALGGGSALVTARAMAIFACEGEDIDAIATSRDAHGVWRSPRLAEPKVPIVALPTVPTTAVSSARTAVTRTGTVRRFAMYDPKTRARSVIVDGDLLATAPEWLTRSAAYNCFSMAVEGLLSTGASPVSDAHMAHAARTMSRHLMEPSNVSREDLMFAAILVGEGAELSSLGLTAALAHVIGHHFGASNGNVDAILLPRVLARLQAKGYPVDERLQHAGLPRHESLVECLGSDAWGLSLSEMGVTVDDVDLIARAAETDFAYSTSPVEWSRAEVRSLLVGALGA